MKSSKIALIAANVVSEEAILKWYKDGHAQKGKMHFLEQMKKFIEWLQNAEEGNSAIDQSENNFFIFLIFFFLQNLNLRRKTNPMDKLTKKRENDIMRSIKTIYLFIPNTFYQQNKLNNKLGLKNVSRNVCHVVVIHSEN